MRAAVAAGHSQGVVQGAISLAARMWKEHSNSTPDCASRSTVMGMCARNHSTLSRSHGRSRMDLTMFALHRSPDSHKCFTQLLKIYSHLNAYVNVNYGRFEHNQAAIASMQSKPRSGANSGDCVLVCVYCGECRHVHMVIYA